MNSNEVLDGQMDLEEKLAAIDAAMKKAQEKSDTERKAQGLPPVPLDPADLTMCEGCQ